MLIVNYYSPRIVTDQPADVVARTFDLYCNESMWMVPEAPAPLADERLSIVYIVNATAKGERYIARGHLEGFAGAGVYKPSESSWIVPGTLQ